MTNSQQRRDSSERGRFQSFLIDDFFRRLDEGEKGQLAGRSRKRETQRDLESSKKQRRSRPSNLFRGSSVNRKPGPRELIRSVRRRKGEESKRFERFRAPLVETYRRRLSGIAGQREETREKNVEAGDANHEEEEEEEEATTNIASRPFFSNRRSSFISRAARCSPTHKSWSSHLSTVPLDSLSLSLSLSPLIVFQRRSRRCKNTEGAGSRFGCTQRRRKTI